jgi:LPS-assembly protein
MIGQSYHLAGRNSYRPYAWGTTDLLNTGLNSGLDKSRSDYVARFAMVSGAGTSFIARGRFDEESLKLRRLEIGTSVTLGQASATLLYSRQDPQPELGFVRRREGVSLSGSLRMPNNWYVTGNVTLDLDRYLTDRDILLTQTGPNFRFVNFNNSPLRPSSYGLGFGYADECTVFSVNYVRTSSDFIGQARKSTTTALLFRLELKHLGELNYRRGEATPQPDGIR